MKTAIIHAKLLLEDHIIWDGALTFEDGIITQVGRMEDVSVPEDAEIIDAKGLYLAPGLIDIHNHGSEDDLFAKNPQACCDHFIRHGETTILPTFYCNLTLEQMLKGAEMIREISKSGTGRIMDGLYMEGPYMSGGGSNQKYIKWQGDILPEEYVPLVQGLKGFARVWAIDPARKGIDGFMEYLHREDPDAIFSLGHSCATAADCRRVKKYGVKNQTHHCDSGKAPGFAQGCIGAGCDEYTLYNPDMYAELICDQNGVHVPPDMIKMVVRTKGVEKMILITDCMPADPERFKNNEAEGIAWGPDLNYDYEGHLAGSHLTLENACRNLMAHAGYGICQAIRMATANPARMLGIDDKVGTLEVGKLANLILIDDTVRIKTVWLQGDKMVQDGELL